jgi:hypothetical protein
VIITIGFTESDRARDYSSFSDGYRIGAWQASLTIALEGAATGVPDEDLLEAVFAAAGNHPAPQTLTGLAGAVFHALAEQVHHGFRSLSVGDTVTIKGQMWACDPAGWHRVDASTAACETPAGGPYRLAAVAVSHRGVPGRPSTQT